MAVVAAAVVVVLVVVVGVVVGVRALAGGGDDRSADPAPRTSGLAPSAPSSSTGPVTPSTAPTSITPVRATRKECHGGTPGAGVPSTKGTTFSGGGLSLNKPAGFSPEQDAGASYTFADGVSSPSKLVETYPQGLAWIATYGLGGLPRASGFTDVEQAAGAVLTCMTRSSTFYRNFTGRTDLVSTATTVDGRPAWEVDAEIRVDEPGLNFDGDTAKVVVVDVGDPARYGLFLSVVPIGRAGLLAQQQKVAASLRVG